MDPSLALTSLLPPQSFKHTQKADGFFQKNLIFLVHKLLQCCLTLSKKHHFSAGLQSPVLSDPPPPHKSTVPANIFLIYSSPTILTSSLLLRHILRADASDPFSPGCTQHTPHHMFTSAQMSPRQCGLPRPCYVKLPHLTALYGLPLHVHIFFSIALKTI